MCVILEVIICVLLTVVMCTVRINCICAIEIMYLMLKFAAITFAVSEDATQ